MDIIVVAPDADELDAALFDFWPEEMEVTGPPFVAIAEPIVLTKQQRADRLCVQAAGQERSKQ